MKKKTIVSLSLIVALIAIIAGGTYAYFTDTTDKKENVFTVGNVDIELEEKWEEPGTVVPGKSYEKSPWIENKGANDAWVRMRVTVSDAAAFEAAFTRHGISDLSTVFGGHREQDWSRAEIVQNNDDTLTYIYNYRNVLPSKTLSSPIFDSVTLPAVFDNKDMESLGDKFTITVQADAIQEDGFTSVEDAFKTFDNK